MITGPLSLDHKLSRIQKQIAFRKAHQNKFELLTSRELEVLTLIVHDFTSKQIANKLFISRLTVEQHRKNINRKLSARSFYQLIQYGLAFDLL